MTTAREKERIILLAQLEAVLTEREMYNCSDLMRTILGDTGYFTAQRKPSLGSWPPNFGTVANAPYMRPYNQETSYQILSADIISLIRRMRGWLPGYEVHNHVVYAGDRRGIFTLITSNAAQR